MNIKSLLPSLSISADVFSPSGERVFSFAGPGHSWTRNAYLYLFAALTGCGGGGVATFGPGYMTSKNIAGVLTNVTTSNLTRGAVTALLGTGLCPSTAISTMGLVCGSGDTAFSIEDYCLAALISHGSAAGQLSYGVGALPVLSYVGGVWQASHVRRFTNLSGAEITVKEIGLTFLGGLFGVNYSYLFSRDVLETPIPLGHLALLELTYNLTYDFSVIDGL